MLMQISCYIILTYIQYYEELKQYYDKVHFWIWNGANCKCQSPFNINGGYLDNSTQMLMYGLTLTHLTGEITMKL